MNLPLFECLNDDILDLLQPVIDRLRGLPFEQQIDALNRVRAALHEASPFRDEPVDTVYWKLASTVHPNDYNPNVVYAPEMKLLETSMAKHVTQPVVTSKIGDEYLITDGEHRYITATTSPQLCRLRGYIPVTVTRSKTLPEHMADTVEHNRARGVHKLDAMTDIVLSMLREGWTDNEIAKHLGMDADEILRMKQVSGIAKAFERPDYNRAWINDDGQESLD